MIMIPQGKLFLISNSLPDDKIRNLSYERLFGKLIATQDNMAIILANKKDKEAIKNDNSEIWQQLCFLPI